MEFKSGCLVAVLCITPGSAHSHMSSSTVPDIPSQIPQRRSTRHCCYRLSLGKYTQSVVHVVFDVECTFGAFACKPPSVTSCSDGSCACFPGLSDGTLEELQGSLRIISAL